MTFSGWSRKLVLTIHIVTAVGFIGAVTAFLALAIVGTIAGDQQTQFGAYISMGIITSTVIVPLAFASLAIGIFQSLGTPWGLFRHYWIIIKLALTLIAAAVLLLQTENVNALATAASRGSLEGYAAMQMSMIVHGIGGLSVLLIATILSVYKPRGATGFGPAAA